MLYLKASSDIQILDSYNGQTGLFLKTFALNDKRNKNGWRVTWESIKQYIADFVTNTRPGIEYTKCVEEKCDLDHIEASTFDRTVEMQEPFRVTDIVDYTLNEDTHTAYFIHKVTNANFAQLVRSGKRLYVSPMLWPMSGGYDVKGINEKGLPVLDVYKWKAVHDAFVNDPAFGDEAKITAMCEGADCQMKLLSAKELMTNKRNSLEDSQFAYVDKNGNGHLPIYDAIHTRNALARFNQTDIPENEKPSVRAKICRAAKRFRIDSDFCSNVVKADELAPLMQVPLIVKHKGHLTYASISAKISDELEPLMADDTMPTSEIVTKILKNNSFSACSCSGIRKMDEKDMQAKIDEAKKASDDKLAAAQKTIKDLKSKLAKMKADSEDDDDDDDNNEDNDDDSNDDENENQNSQKNKKGKKGTKGAKAKFEDPRIKGLEQELAIPIIEKMVKAREMQGMPKEQIEEFTKAVSAKSLEEVKSQYNSEKFFIESISAKQEQPDKVHFEFNGNNGAPLTAKSIEEVLGEVSA